MEINLNEVIKQFKAKDYRHFDDFYDKTNRQVYFSIIQIVKDDDIAKDLMQDTYMNFINKIDQFKLGGNVYAYLSTIGRNLSINYYNKNKKEIHSEELFETIPSNEVVKEKDDQDILDLLNFLNKDQREVVVLHTINGLKFKEVAKIMDKPLGTVLWLHKAAIDILKTKVGDTDEK
jgi:RNA polymerase sigma-70 factor (ECF subfamily)